MNLLNKFYKKLKTLVKKNNFVFFFYYYLSSKISSKFIIKNDFNIISTYKWFNLKNKDYCFIPTYPSSGWNYLNNVLNYYFNKQKFQKNFFTYKKGNYYNSRKFKHHINFSADFRGTICIFKEKVFGLNLIHTHANLNNLPFFRNKLLYSDKIIFIVRDTYSSLYSLNKKNGNSKKTFEWKDLEAYVDFYNSYYEFLFDKKTLIIYSKNLNSKNSFDNFKNILNYLLNNQKKQIDENLLKESIEFFSYENELSRSDSKSNKNFFKGLKNYKNYFSTNQIESINDYLKKNLHPDIYNLLLELD